MKQARKQARKQAGKQAGRWGSFASALLLIVLGRVADAGDTPLVDVPGARDLLLLPRYQDARIISYDRAEDEEAVLPAGRFHDFGFTATRTLEGRVTRIAYAFPKMLSTINIMNHYRDVLKGAGFSIVFACDGADQCGGFSFGEALTQPLVEAHPGDEGGRVIDFLHPVGGDIRYVLATLERPQGRITLALAAARHVQREPGLFIEAVEQDPDHDAVPVLSATQIESALRAQGRIALYSIHFAGHGATISPDSREILSPVAAMLRTKPAMKLIIVGHSDGSMPMAQGVQLSAARAQAVMQALVQCWHVSATQVDAVGIGPVAPVASNADPAGRALNSRIELVLQ